jgi:LytR cell envelope-related transcriptional attenuator
MRTAPQLRGERGQVLSSAVAVAAVVAVVIGLLVLFGTGGPGGGSDDTGSGGTSPSTSTASSPAPSTPQVTPSTVSATPQTTPQTTPPSQQPTSAPTRPSDTTEPPEATERPTATGPRPSVEIYNNTTQRGLADRVSRRARDAGWRVAGIDNWRGKVAASTVYYPAGLRDHATALASDLGVGRVKEALSNMKKDRLTVILTSDYSG